MLQRLFLQLSKRPLLDLTGVQCSLRRRSQYFLRTVVPSTSGALIKSVSGLAVRECTRGQINGQCVPTMSAAAENAQTSASAGSIHPQHYCCCCCCCCCEYPRRPQASEPRNAPYICNTWYPGIDSRYPQFRRALRNVCYRVNTAKLTI